MEYKVVIGAKLNGNLCYFDLDTCTERSVTSNATIPQYPVESGVTISDHMYRNARSVALSGSFSLAGKNAYENNNCYTKTHIIGDLVAGNKSWERWFEEDASDLKDLSVNNRLEAIQKVFEYIQAKGILCTIMMCSKDNSGVSRFKVRDNMALQSISWREAYNSMTYNFTFTEVITITSIGEFETFAYNDLYPSTSLPATKTLGEMMIESNNTVQIVLESLLKNGYLAAPDAVAFSAKAAGAIDSTNNLGILASVLVFAIGPALVAAGYGAIVGVATIAAKIGITVAVSTGPVGWIVGGAIAVVVGTVMGVISIVRHTKESYRQKHNLNLIQNYKKYYDDDCNPTGENIDTAQVNTTDLAKLQVLLEDAEEIIENTLSNITVYSIPESDTSDQSCDVPVQCGVDYLTLRFTQNTVDNSNPFTLTVFDGLGDNASEKQTLGMRTWTYVTNIYDCDAMTNGVCRDSSKQYTLYLYNPAAASDEDATKAGFESADAAKKDLTAYYVVIAQGNIKNSLETMSKNIMSMLSEKGYKDL